ncbi:MFS monosaccharide transporter, putative [Talaromyces stipitatus ATCC 10500]|uniref:MFS monosaccharide transporter, putative n=1 Tax=Talaromyces stipitatus (strain ATCC 10500 / CBS 375.48 / QM 6759 / NRRL 1006) TaxID=441959 RepID=B8M3U5_TALSN|nr:MFS monosaccharide transporter, putative [Talaromyces stipitatus ATCC 10500]EED20688.1 MFS monosaccharide transporter, putative [Talaromyces stipitatus ATCC 10500]
MTVSQFLNKLKPKAEQAEHSENAMPSATTSGNASLAEKNAHYDDSKVPYLTWRSFILGIIASMGGFIFGYSTGQISGFETMHDFQVRFAQHNDNGYYFSNVRSGLIVGLMSIGTMIGALAASPLADRFGRKPSITFWCIIHIVGMIVQIATTNKWYQVAVGRLVAGLGVGALSSLVPMYQSESAPRHVRGAMVSAFQLFVAFGIFIAACINYGTESIHSTAAWRITMGIGFAWPLILGIGILFLPESPRYAYRMGRIEEAKHTMIKLYGVPDNHRLVAEEIQDMKEKLDEEHAAGKAGIFEIFTGPRMLYRTMLGVVLQSLQQLTGANFIFYYGNTIFTSTGLNNSYVTQMILTGVNFGVTIIGLYIVEHYGRRKSLIGGALWMFVCFMIFATVGHYSLDRANPPNTPKAGTTLIVFTCFFIVGFATTWGPIVWAICGELYPARYRATCIGIATASNWTWNFLISFFTPFISGAIDFQYGYIFACCCFAAALVVYFFVCETQGRTLEEVDTMYIQHVKPWKSSSWVAPEHIHRAAAEEPEDKAVGGLTSA